MEILFNSRTFLVYADGEEPANLPKCTLANPKVGCYLLSNEGWHVPVLHISPIRWQKYIYLPRMRITSRRKSFSWHPDIFNQVRLRLTPAERRCAMLVASGVPFYKAVVDNYRNPRRAMKSLSVNFDFFKQVAIYMNEDFKQVLHNNGVTLDKVAQFIADNLNVNSKAHASLKIWSATKALEILVSQTSDDMSIGDLITATETETRRLMPSTAPIDTSKRLPLSLAEEFRSNSYPLGDEG